MTWLLRFFRVTAARPVWMLALLTALGLYAGAITAVDVRSVDEALAMLLLSQMFSASAGFRQPAAAGHFAPALVRFDRARVAVAHAMHAIWPVTALWAAVGVIDAIAHGGTPLAVEPGRLAAFAFVSLASWAFGLPAPRLLTGALWLGVIVASVTSRCGPGQYAAMLNRADGSIAELLHATALAVVCPFIMMGDHMPPRDGITITLAIASAVAAAAGVLYVARRDYPLEASL